MNINGAWMQSSYASSGNHYADRAISQQTGNGLFPKNTSQKQNGNLHRMISDMERNTSGSALMQTGSSSIFSSTQSYGESLRAQRQNAKDTSLALKKLRYQFKSISTKILRSKTSLAARQVAGQARREVLRLKREKQSQNSDYDAEELEAAITHAQAMERVAKKKVRHLEEEELAKAAGGMCADAEVKDKEASPEEQAAEEERAEDALSSDGVQGDALTDEAAINDETPSAWDAVQDDVSVEAFYTHPDYEELSRLLENMDLTLSDMEELTSEVLDEFSQSMQEMLEEMGLGELTDSLLAIKGDMDPADLKLMKIRHRNKEMKEIVKADAEYLKAVFDQMEKEKSGGVVPQSSGGVSFGSTGSPMATNLAASLSAVTGIPMSEPVINVIL